MVDRTLPARNADLASRAKVIEELDARLVLIDPAAGVDKYHVLQGLEDPSLEGEARFFGYQRWGETGTAGDGKIDGPMTKEEVKALLAGVFGEKTGAEWGALKPGDRVPTGMYWLQQAAQPDLKAKWEYYVDDGVDGKEPGWYPYEEAASDEVEEIHAQHEANERESRTANRTVTSGYFAYRVDLAAMTQTNTRTKKVREIRRVVGSGPGSQNVPARAKKGPKVAREAGAVKLVRAGKAMKAVRAMKSMKAMKAMKAKKAKKAKRESKIAKGKYAKKHVFEGKKEKTSAGLTKADLMKSKTGKIVSLKKSAHSKRLYKHVEKWIEACKRARVELGINGFEAVKKGSALYGKAREHFGAAAAEPAEPAGPAGPAEPAAAPGPVRKASTKSLG